MLYCAAAAAAAGMLPICRHAPSANRERLSSLLTIPNYHLYRHRNCSSSFFEKAATAATAAADVAVAVAAACRF